MRIEAKSYDHQVCNCLRWKSLFYQVNPTLPLDDDDYWCALTQRILGPDDQIVGTSTCKPGRTCFRQITS